MLSCLWQMRHQDKEIQKIAANDGDGLLKKSSSH